MKLIKLNEEDYIIEDDSEIKKDCIVLTESNKIGKVLRYFQRGGEINYHISMKELTPTSSTGCKKITHSTKPLEDVIIANKYKEKGWVNIKPLSLSEIEELIFGYSVKKLSEEKCKTNLSYLIDSTKKWFWKKGFKAGFNAHKELVKDKLFTITELEKSLVKLVSEISSSDGELIRQSPAEAYNWIRNHLKELQPTEWDVQFVNGKLTLKQ